jgi:hypothetical protein
MGSLTTDTEFTLRSAAIAQGYAAISVAPQTVNRTSAPDSGDWFVLSIKRQAGDDWELLGRRRTRLELLAMVKTICSPLWGEANGPVL